MRARSLLEELRRGTPLEHRAADEIERLTAERDRLRAEIYKAGVTLRSKLTLVKPVSLNALLKDE